MVNNYVNNRNRCKWTKPFALKADIVKIDFLNTFREIK